MNKQLWSYSRLSSFSSCPYGWYLHYIEQEPEEDNWYAVHGSLVHEILEAIANKEMSLDEASMYYADHYDDNLEYISEKIKDSTYEKCSDFFATYDFNYLKDNEVVGAEVHLPFTIGDSDFHCYIDLLLKNKDGEYIIFDYKSSAYPFKKNGKDLLKSQENIFQDHKRQLYLYAEAVKQNYGKYPIELSWLHFKDSKVASIPFDMQNLEETVNWAKKNIEEITKEEEFPPNLNNFIMCNSLCGYRHSCLYKEFEDEDE